MLMYIIGIAGGTGSGKTTVARKIIESLPQGEVALIPQDSYYIEAYLECDRLPETIRVEPREVILIEGILALYSKELRDLMDLKIFVDADPDERLIRVIERDIAERGRTVQMVVDRYLSVLKPMHLEFIEPTKRYADLIIPQGGNNEKAIGIMRTCILHRLHAPHDHFPAGL